MRPDYGARYRELYERHFWWRAREALLVRRLARLVPPEGFGRILDVGCGDGLSFAALGRFGRVSGVEADADLVSPNGRHREAIHVGPFDPTFTPEHRFGLITMLDVVEHLDDDVAALCHAARLLVPGGVLVVTVPALPRLWTTHDDLNHHRRRYTRATLKRAMQHAGLDIEELEYFFHWLVPLKLLVRLREQWKPRSPAPPEVPGAAWNRLFYLLSRFEQQTWGRLPWPFGSSLWAVGRSLHEDSYPR